MTRFDQITKREIDGVHQRTFTNAQAAHSLDVTEAQYKELCYIYDVVPRDNWQALADAIEQGPSDYKYLPAATPSRLRDITREELVEACEGATNKRTAARALGTSVDQLTRLCDHFEVAKPKNNKKSLTKPEVQVALDQCPTLEKAAERLGVSTNALYYYARKYDLHERWRQRRFNDRKHKEEG